MTFATLFLSIACLAAIGLIVWSHSQWNKFVEDIRKGEVE